MTEHRREPGRRSTRLLGYDYRLPGGYFVTICIEDRTCLFGEVINGEMQTSDYGRIVEEEWRRTADLRQEVQLDLFQVMPNHFHGIIFISETTPGVGTHAGHDHPASGIAGTTSRVGVDSEHDHPASGITGTTSRVGVDSEHDHLASGITGPTPRVGAHGGAPASFWRPPRSLGSLIAGFKSASTKRINDRRGTAGALLWERGYHDRVIRNERELNAMRQYILDNPPNWELDHENPASPGRKPGRI